MKVKNLQKEKYWSTYYAVEKKISVKPSSGLFGSYDLYLCDTLLQNHIPSFTASRIKNPKICEIGSGDGKLLVKLARMFSAKPYGIEYSPEAAIKSRKLDVTAIISDVFAPAILKKYKNYFDIVFSYGFIEHIMPPNKAIKLHIDLTKPGGYVVVQIPRFKGFNRWRINFFRPDLVEGHNMDIMEADILKKLCKDPRIEKIYCANYGTYKIRIPMETKNYKYYMLKALCTLEYALSPLCRLLFGTKGYETYTFSPAVMFIGKKIK